MMSSINPSVICSYVVNMACGGHARAQGDPLKPAIYTLGFSGIGALGFKGHC